MRKDKPTSFSGRPRRRPRPPSRRDRQEFSTALAVALRTRIFGRRIHYFDEVDSTNTVARQLAREGAREGAVVVADGQTKGRGRLGKTFFSPPGVNLYLSLVLRPNLAPPQVPRLTLVAGVAVAQTVESFAGVQPSLKWPNDTLLCGRKVSGILTEMEMEGAGVGFVVVGIGVNLNCPEEVFPRELRATATSILIETGKKVDRAAFAAELLGRLEDQYFSLLDQGFEPARSLWDTYCHLAGKTVRVSDGASRVEGRVCGLDKDGALVLEAEAGQRLRVVAGEVTVLGAGG